MAGSSANTCPLCGAATLRPIRRYLALMGILLWLVLSVAGFGLRSLFDLSSDFAYFIFGMGGGIFVQSITLAWVCRDRTTDEPDGESEGN